MQKNEFERRTGIYLTAAAMMMLISSMEKAEKEG